MLDLKEKKILVTGGHGFIGRHVIENLTRLRGVPGEHIIVPDSNTDDLRVFENCTRLLKEHRIDLILHLAARVGGVGYSSIHPATQYYDNLQMDLNIVEASKNTHVEKIVLVSSACAYPRDARYPLTENDIWNGLPQETNRAYGVAKRVMLTQAEAYTLEYGMNIPVVVPGNAYGPGDNFHPEHSHVIPSLIRKCLANQSPLVVWGDGTPTRDFLYVKDFAEGVLLAAEKMNSQDGWINLGSGVETRISDLVGTIMKLTGYVGKIVYDTNKPNGQPKRSVDIKKARSLLGFEPKYSLELGLRETITWYKEQESLRSAK